MMLKIGVILTHPVQYYSPWFTRLAKMCELKVYYAHQQTGGGQAAAGFDTAFDWDVPLLEGYPYQFLHNVARKPGLQSFWGCDTPEIYQIINAESLDALLMFGWNRKSYMQAWYAAIRCGTPVFVRLDSQLGTQRTFFVKWLKKIVYSLVLPFAADYLSPGRRSDEYLRHYSVPLQRTHRLAHMVDTQRFQQGAMDARQDGGDVRFRERYQATKETHVFLFIGKLINKKRPDIVIKALKKLAEKNVQLWIVGDGSLRAELGLLAEDMPVHFLGFVNQSKLPEIYAAADCLVLPSDAGETWGLVVNESFACGTPAIVSKEVGCSPDLIIENKTGWLLGVANEDMLAIALAKAINSGKTFSQNALMQKTLEGSYDVGVEKFLKCVMEKKNTIDHA